MKHGTEARVPAVLAALSGGVDSAVAALLLSRETACAGVALRLNEHTDINAAREAAAFLRIPFYEADARAAFERHVIARFVNGYRAGVTPNPCVDCNRFVKFAVLRDFARSLGAPVLATGHYARLTRDANGRFRLCKALDRAKDQSYMLYALPVDWLPGLRFPLGETTKPETRELARQAGFQAADRPDSQDLCFAPDGDHAAFIERHTGQAAEPGLFLDAQGREIGRHAGLIRYTVGQRKGLGVAHAFPLYVREKNTAANTVVLCGEEGLYTRRLRAGDFNWLIPAPTEPFSAAAKLRYRQDEQPCRVHPEADGTVSIEFKDPQRAVAPGQAAVLYDGETVLGGGTIL